MTQKTTQRVRINQQGNVTIYSASAWPGWHEIRMLCFGFLIILVLFSVFSGLTYSFSKMFSDITPYRWVNMLLGGLFSGGFTLSWMLMLGFILLWMPYFLIYTLSPKQFWIENDTLFQAAYLLGFIPHKRKISFEQILSVEAKSSNGQYAVEVVYERSIPKWLFVILVYWNEKLTQWPLLLVNGIPTIQEAQEIQTALLEPMTTSDVCRVGTEVTELAEDGKES